MRNCIIGNCDLFERENTIGKPLEYDICLGCWEDLSKVQREKYIKDGVIPVTRFIVDDDWRDFCSKYGMKP